MDRKNPLIIPRPEHTLSRSSLSPNAVQALYRLKKQGFTAYLVGGCVRDLLLGREPKDFDLVTDATPGQVKRLFRNCRLVGRRFRLAHLHFADEIIEVATFRAPEPNDSAEEELLPLTALPVDSAPARTARPPRHLKSEEGVVLRDNVFGTPEQDALRRDFTVNAMFYDIGDFSLIDYCGGIDDLKLGVIRTIGHPAERFIEDPVRMLRAIRFAAILGFTIEDATWIAIVEQSANIARSAPPRLYEEVLKLFLCGEGEQSYQLLRRSGLLQALFPDFSDWLESETDAFPHVRVGVALDWIDRRIMEGGKVSPQFLLALMFGEYLEAKAKCLRRSGTPLQQSLDMAIAGLLGELAGSVLIPYKVGMQLREILSSQHRLSKTPGKRPLSFISRDSFTEAMEYFRFICATGGEGIESIRWWEHFVMENPLPPKGKIEGNEVAVAPAIPAKRVRRRRRPKKMPPQQSP
jgi:poly(A) polymerase